MELRESFVLHAEYIEDLPEELKNTFLRYIYDYGIKSIEPSLSGLELTVWTKIKRRIDDDVASYNRKVANLKQNKKRTVAERNDNKTVDNRTVTESTPNGDRTVENMPRTDSVSVNDNVNVSVNECESKEVTPTVDTPKKQTKRAVKPTLEEIRDYCLEKNLKVEPERFYYFYDSKGWKVGKEPMKNWKSALSGWSARSSQQNNVISSDKDKDVLKDYQPKTADIDFEKNLNEMLGGKDNECDEQEQEQEKLIY